MTEQPLGEFLDDFGLSGERKAEVDKADHPGIRRDLWGLFPDVDIVAYHLDQLAPEPSLSNSGMGRLLDETPLDFAYHHPRLNPDAVDEAKDSAAKRRGDVVHQLALGKGRGYAVLDFDDFRTNAAKSARDNAIADGLTPIKRKDFEPAEVMAEVIRERIKEALDGADYQTEVAFVYQEMTAAGPIWVRGLMDVWCEELGVILDPKSTAMLYDGKVARHLLAMGWDRQASLYPHAIGQLFPERAGRIHFADLMVKPEAPFTSRLVGLEKAWEYSSVKQCRIAMERFGACIYAGKWPGFGTSVDRIAMPAWEDKRREVVELAEGA
jgi:hypothetical protein